MSTYNCRGAINGIIVQNNPVNFVDPFGLVKWKEVGKGLVGVFGGIAVAGGGVALLSSGGGAVGGAFLISVGGSSVAFGISKIIAGFTDNEFPFSGIKDAIIINTTDPGTLQDSLLGANKIADKFLTKGAPSSKLSNCNSVLQEGTTIIDETINIIKNIGGDENSNNKN